MPDRAREYIDPVLFAERGRTCSGQLPISSMERLCASLKDCRGKARYELEFLKEGKLFIVRGQVYASPVLECQVCLKEMILAVDVCTKLCIVKTVDELSLLPDSCEPLMVPDRKISLLDIVEDELLLALPIIPRHVECETDSVTKLSGQMSKDPAKKPNPFSILADFNKTGDN